MIRLLFVLAVLALVVGMIAAHVPWPAWVFVFGLLAVLLLIVYKAPSGRSPGTR